MSGSYLIEVQSGQTSSALSNYDAIITCEKLDPNNKWTWRLPTAIEMFAIFQSQNITPPIDEDLYKNIWYRTLSQRSAEPAGQIVVQSSGFVDVAGSNAEWHVRCVRDSW